MKPIVILILSLGVMGSAVVQAQEGSAVPRQGTVVAQAPGTFTSPGSALVVAPAAAPVAMVPALVVMGATVAGVAASGTSGATVSH
jgi:hypothetical protein